MVWYVNVALCGVFLQHEINLYCFVFLQLFIVLWNFKAISYKGRTLIIPGVYLPLLWERAFCSKVPITLGYTRGHFSALVPMEMDTDMPLGAGAHIDNAVDEQVFYLPLMDHEGTFLPIHFISSAEVRSLPVSHYYRLVLHWILEVPVVKFIFWDINNRNVAWKSLVRNQQYGISQDCMEIHIHVFMFSS